MLVLHGPEGIEASSRCNPLGPELLATPRSDDQIGLPCDYLVGRRDAVLGGALISSISENVHATGDLDELGDPTSPGDQRIVPFLEKDPRPLR